MKELEEEPKYETEIEDTIFEHCDNMKSFWGKGATKKKCEYSIMTTRNKRKKYKKSGGTRKKTSKCSPAVKGNTINKNSCLKKSLLSNTIFEGNQSIRDVIDECTNDDKCIISKITDDNKRRR